MSDTVLAALISAVASVLVAILSKSVESPKDSRPRDASSIAVRSTSTGNMRWWYVASAILLIWLALSPALVHHDLAGTNFLVIPVVALLLSLAAPIPPLRAAWIVLALFAANFVLGPLSNQLHGSSNDIQWIYPPRERGKQLFALLIGFGTAAVTAGISYLRLKSLGVTVPASVPPRDQTSDLPRDTHLSLATELEKLTQLHEKGTLSLDEFMRAKKKLLDSH